MAAVCKCERLWCGDGRSAASRNRAAAAGMRDAGSVNELAARADVIISVCPPGAATEVAQSVADEGFDGIYVDVNAIAPATSRQIGTLFARFVDGGVVGPPVSSPGTTRLYLSGQDAIEVAQRWRDTALETRILDGGAGTASALKVCFATWTKGTAALLLAVRALAVAEGVDEALLAEWATSKPDLAEQSQRAASQNAPRAWRFEGELKEIAESFAAHGLPDGFGRAAADVYARLAEFKDTTGTTLEAVIEALNQGAVAGQPATPPQ